MRVSLIVAVSQNYVIGRAGRLPWRLAADLRRFQRLTMGHHLIMGRKTYESIGRPLPGRTSIVVTRQAQYAAPGVVVARGVDEALQAAAGDSEVFIIGGGELYRQAMPRVERIYMTVVAATVEGDTFFPELDADQWQTVAESLHPADARNEFAHRFLVCERRAAALKPPAGSGPP
jgi:dihydrofolate reductase